MEGPDTEAEDCENCLSHAQEEDVEYQEVWRIVSALLLVCKTSKIKKS